MAEVVRDSLQRLTRDDVTAMVVYLESQAEYAHLLSDNDVAAVVTYIYPRGLPVA